MYLVCDLVGPINRLFLLAVILLKWWLKSSFGNVLGLFNLALMEAPLVSSLICNCRGINYSSLWHSILVQAGSLDEDNCLVYQLPHILSSSLIVMTILRIWKIICSYVTLEIFVVSVFNAEWRRHTCHGHMACSVWWIATYSSRGFWVSHQFLVSQP